MILQLHWEYGTIMSVIIMRPYWKLEAGGSGSSGGGIPFQENPTWLDSGIYVKLHRDPEYDLSYNPFS